MTKVYFDKNGSYAGHINDDGTCFDRDGNFSGHIREDGMIFDRDGQLVGKREDRD